MSNRAIIEKELTQGAVPIGIPKAYNGLVLLETAKELVETELDIATNGLASKVARNTVYKVDKPVDAQGGVLNGNDGEYLRTKGNGKTEWAEIGVPSDTQVHDIMMAWLDEHPEVAERIGNASYLGQQEITAAINNLSLNHVNNKVWSFPNVQAMFLAPLVAGSMATTKGYYAVNDGGAGKYTIRAKTAEDVVDNGSIIELDNGNVAELITDGTVCPEQFGAVGDGTHDDHVAINNAIATGKKVVLSKTYYAPNILVQNGTHIEGASDNTAELITNIGLNNAVRDVVIENVKITEDDNTIPVLLISDGAYNTFRNVKLIGELPLKLTNLNSSYCYYNSFYDCVFYKVGGQNNVDIEINNDCNANMFVNCMVYGSTQKAVYIKGGQGNVFYKCTLQDYHGHGVYIDGDTTCIKNVFDCCYIEPDTTEAAEADYPYYNAYVTGTCRFNAFRNCVMGATVFKNPPQDYYCDVANSTNIYDCFQGSNFPSIGTGFHLTENASLTLRSYEGGNGSFTRYSGNIYFGERGASYMLLGAKSDDSKLNIEGVDIVGRLKPKNTPNDYGYLGLYGSALGTNPETYNFTLTIGGGNTWYPIPKLHTYTTYGMSVIDLNLFSSFAFIRNKDTNVLYYAVDKIIYNLDGTVYRST